ncbi:MAG: acyl-CoA dehydrogenase family protein [Flavobacteriales bacterium]
MNLSKKYESVDREISKKITDELLLWIRDFFKTRVNSRWIDERRCIPPHIVLEFAKKGLFGFHIEKKHGGLALNASDWIRLIGQLGALDATISQLVAINALSIRPIMSYGSEEQKSKYLEDLAKGNTLCAFAQTEDRAGTNFTHLRTTSAFNQSQNEWTINGDKMWIGNAGWSGMMVIISKATDESNTDLGLNSFLAFTDAPGIELGVELNTLGLRGVVQNKIRLNNLKIHHSMLLGNQGEGMQVAVDAMSFTRLVISAQQIGLMKRAVLIAHDFVTKREVSTGKLIENPVAINILSECIARILVIEKFLNIIAVSFDKNEEIAPEISSICKVLSTEFAGYVTDKTLQLLGGRGYEENNVIPQLVRDTRVTRIFEGPSEALLCFVGSRIKVDGGKKIFSTLFDPNSIDDVTSEIIEKIAESDSYAYEFDISDKQKEFWKEYKSGVIGSWAILKLTANASDDFNEDILAWLDSGYAEMPRFVQGDCFLSADFIDSTIRKFIQEVGFDKQLSPSLNWEADELLNV